jgi:hypothetical protein
MIAAIARLPLARLVRSRRSWLCAGGWFALGLIAAVVAHERGSSTAAGHALLGPAGGIALPLLAFGLVSAVFSGDRLARSGAPLVAFGAPAALVGVVSSAVAALTAALLGAVMMGLVALLAHGSADPPLFRDMAASAYVGALGAAAYAQLFAAASAFGPRGAGRVVALVLDFVVGSGVGAASLPLPRAHVRNLLGGTPPVDLSERASAVALVMLIALYGLACAALARRRR